MSGPATRFEVSGIISASILVRRERPSSATGVGSALLPKSMML